MKEQIWKHVLKVREQSPLVHNITNYVVMNNTANALLAAGASPVMAHAHLEVKDMVSIAGALVVNIGTLDEYWVESMRLAASHAALSGKPWVLDPVGAGATPYRDEVLKEMIQYRPSIIRGNASEILALAKKNGAAIKGVDSLHQSEDAVTAARSLNKQYGAVICISGATDIIIQGNKQASLHNGSPLMAKVTGLGCTASALIAAFAAVDQDYFLATVSGMALLGVAGELAALQAAGPGTLQLHLLDLLYNLNENQFSECLNYSFTHEP